MSQQKVTIIKSYLYERESVELVALFTWIVFKKILYNQFLKPILQIVLFLSTMGSMFDSTIYSLKYHAFFFLHPLKISMIIPHLAKASCIKQSPLMTFILLLPTQQCIWQFITSSIIPKIKSTLTRGINRSSLSQYLMVFQAFSWARCQQQTKTCE